MAASKTNPITDVSDDLRQMENDDDQELERRRRQEEVETSIENIREYSSVLSVILKAEWVFLAFCFLAVLYSITGKVWQLIQGSRPDFWDASISAGVGIGAGTLYVLISLVHLLLSTPYSRIYALLTAEIDRSAATDGYEHLTGETKKVIGRFRRLLHPPFFVGKIGFKIHMAIGAATSLVALFFSITRGS